MILPAVLYAAIVSAFWFGLRGSAAAQGLGNSFPRAFASFALLLAPLWFFGFGAADRLQSFRGWKSIACASVLALPYFAFAVGSPVFLWPTTLIVIFYPVLLAAFAEAANPERRMTARDAVLLILIAATYYMKLLQNAWPAPALAVLPKLYLADIALYCFLVVRRLDATGYSLIPTWPAVVIGFREWAFYVPIALVVGTLTGFLHPHRAGPQPFILLVNTLFTFLIIALPEELFFRSILQSLLETRFGRTGALCLASLLFGFSHFNHVAGFNWRYVLLAAIAGIFYGRAWRARRHIFASVVTHAMVDVVWSLWL